MNYVVKRAFGVACLSALAWTFNSPATAYAGHRSHGSYGSHGSSGGSHGSSGGSYGSHGSSGGSYGSHGSSGGANGGTAYRSNRRSGNYGNRSSQRAWMLVKVPANANVYFENQRMSLTGPTRQYYSPALPAGQEFVYTIRVEVNRAGQLVSTTTKTKVRAGARIELDFAENAQTAMVASVRHLTRIR